MSEQAKCSARITPEHSFHSYACGRVAKEDGLCGIHLAAQRRVQANDEKRKQKVQAEETARHETEDALAALGIKGQPWWSYATGRYMPGMAVVSVDELRRICAARGEDGAK